MHISLQEIAAARQAAATPRHDIYAGIHKGARLLLSDVMTRAGRVDAGDPAALADLAERVAALADFFDAHLTHEDTFIHPVLERACPGTSQRIAAEHREHERDIAVLREHARLLAGCAPEERRALCRTLYHALGLFTAHNLVHMHIEETDHNAVLWAHCSDEEIAAIEGRLIAHLTPGEMMSSMRWMIPGLAPSERLALLSGMREQAPAPAFEAVLGLARETLAGNDLSALMRALGLPVVPGLVA